MIDLHCHLLPGVDDGPDTIDESLDYARLAVSHGTELIVATPHVEHVDVRELPERVRELREALELEDIALRIECGGELKPHSLPALGQDELDIIAHGPPGRRWLLLEVPFRGLDEDLLDAADELDRRGFGVVLAHPERSAGFDDSVAVLRERVAGGAAIQMNVGPLLGVESGEREAAARRLLRAGIATALATDAHPPGRPYTLRDGYGAAGEHGASEAEAIGLVADGPRSLLAHGIGFHAGFGGIEADNADELARRNSR